MDQDKVLGLVILVLNSENAVFVNVMGEIGSEELDRWVQESNVHDIGLEHLNI